MSEIIGEVTQFEDTMYTQSLHGETIHEYKLLGLFGLNLPGDSIQVFSCLMEKLEPYGPWTLY